MKIKKMTSVFNRSHLFMLYNLFQNALYRTVDLNSSTCNMPNTREFLPYLHGENPPYIDVKVGCQTARPYFSIF